MAKYIEFPVMDHGIMIPQVFNTTNVTLVTPNGTNNVILFCGLVSYVYPIEEGVGSVKLTDAINKAILSISGPLVTNVVIPEGITIKPAAIHLI